MRIQFCGANRNVTGSKHLIEANGKRVLLDCGMFQGRRQESEELNRKFPFDPKGIDAVVLSHAHLDHCGSLPTLVKQGFKGKVYATPATAEVAHHIMQDSAHIQEQDAVYINEKKRRRNEPLIEPLYTVEEAKQVESRFVSVPYGKAVELLPGIELTIFDAGHILGSSLIYLTIQEGGKLFRLAYTGDLGRMDVPILQNPAPLPECDFLITESTYGDREHEPYDEVEQKVIEIVQRAQQSKGAIVVPAFALGRTQTLVYVLHKLTDEGRLPRIPIFVDSPLAMNITEVFRRHPECFDHDTYQDFLRQDEDPFGFRNLRYVDSREESIALNTRQGPVMIIASSGMCEAGRIRHHLQNRISDPKNTILITGFMAANTLGRRLHHGETKVKIFDRWFEVNAKVEVINAFSAHADQSELLRFIGAIPSLQRVFLVHGEAHQANVLRLELQARHPELQVEIPEFEQSFGW